MTQEELNKKLLDAAESDDIDGMKEALSLGADVNAVDDYGNTALILACQGRNIDTVQLLLEYNADINTKNYCGDTALIWACVLCFLSRSNSLFVELLLNTGADPNIIDNSHKTALMYLASQGYTELMKTLITAGADINAKNIEGHTALDILKESYPEKYEKWMKQNIKKQRRKKLSMEDSLSNIEQSADWNI